MNFSFFIPVVTSTNTSLRLHDILIHLINVGLRTDLIEILRFPGLSSSLFWDPCGPKPRDRKLREKDELRSNAKCLVILRSQTHLQLLNMIRLEKS